MLALQLGQAVRFGNADPEIHNVHARGTRPRFDRNVPPGETIEFVPESPGILRVVCGVHTHMRAYLVVGSSPWVTTCGRSGEFRFKDVPEGRYRLLVWNEMTETLSGEVDVRGSSQDLGRLIARLGPNDVTAEDREEVCLTGCEPWPLVIDRISVTLASSLAASKRPETADRAVALAQDALHRDLEASGLKTAIRVHLGLERESKVEELFWAITQATRSVTEEKASPTKLMGPTHEALLQLNEVSGELTRKGVTERSNIFAKTSPAFFVEDIPDTPATRQADTSFSMLWLVAYVAGPAALVLSFLARFSRSKSVRARSGDAGCQAGGVAVVAILLFYRGRSEPVTRPRPSVTSDPTAPLAQTKLLGPQRKPAVARAPDRPGRGAQSSADRPGLASRA